MHANESSWNLSYERWMIEDGLPNLTIGETHDWFAVWFNSQKDLQRSVLHRRTVDGTKDFKYSVIAQLVFRSDHACVIDFGLIAIGPPSILPEGIAEGKYLTGEIQLGLAHSIAAIPDNVLQSLACTWKVQKIFARIKTAEVASNSPSIQYIEISSTETLSTASYVLQCRLSGSAL